MEALDKIVGRMDRWQQRARPVAVMYAVVKKFGDDQANQLVVALGWYGFTAIYPLLLVVVTIFGFIGARSLGTGIVSTLHEFPVVGTQFNPAHGSKNLHGNVVGLFIGILVLIYGAQGVTQTAQQAMARVWNVPKLDRPGFLPRLGRSLISLTIVGGCFLANAALAALATGSGQATGSGHANSIRVLVIIGMLVINVLLFAAAFRVLTPPSVGTRVLFPGALLGAVGFTLLITLGAGLVQHQLRNSSNTYGQFGIVIGLVGFLLLLAKISLYAAELNPVWARHLWPRSLQANRLTDADARVLRDVTLDNRRRHDEQIQVSFETITPDTVQRASEARPGNRPPSEPGRESHPLP